MKKIYITFVFFFLMLISVLQAAEKRNGPPLFINQDQLNIVFEKLYALEKGSRRKVNIIHFGDSHIQAGFFTGTISKALQSTFGNGGYGFTFPYRFVRTNGPKEVTYTTNVVWTSWVNVKPWNDVGMGLSGIALNTNSSDFAIQLRTNSDNCFSKIKALYPTQSPQYKLSLTADELKTTNVVNNWQIHKIRNGESLSSIAQKYGMPVSKLKQANNLKTDRINAGKTLRIPSRNTIQVSALTQKDIEYVEMKHFPYFSVYTSSVPLDRATFLAENKQDKYTINGFVLENDSPGVIYHSIGVNGAKLSDYNKYPLVFKQLQALEPDLVIISFGTNESFGRMSAKEYMYNLNEFIAKIKEYNQKVQILVMTPPPSLLRRRQPNNYVSDYSIALFSQKSYPVWDLFGHMGGLSSIDSGGEFADLIARDKVHYSELGYERQGYMFASDFVEAYNHYKEGRKN